MSIERFPAAGTASADGPPYSHAVRANGFVFVAGQVGVDAQGQLVEGGIEAEAHQTIRNARAILRERGLDLADVVKVMVWLADPHDYHAFNAVYRQYFGAALPTRACVRSELMGPYKVEIEVMAAEGAAAA